MSRRSDPLGMSTEEMRRLGHQLVDTVVDAYEERSDRPVIVAGDAEELLAALGGPVPAQPGDAAENLQLLVDECLQYMQHGDHPRYFARVPGPSSFAGVLGDWLATGFNVIAASWGGGAGPSAVELVVVSWLAELLGMPPESEGIVLSGGSMANLTAFAAARATNGPGVAYLTDQAHASLGRALRTLGFAGDHIRVLPVGDDLSLHADALARAIADDRRSGRTPALAITTAGTTNSGAVDELDAIAEVCAAERVWFHVDGAYGGPAALHPDGRKLLTGMERADSLVVDPHKWLFTPYDAGVLLVRHPGSLERAFSMNPEYLADVRASATAQVDFGNRGPELTRRARALKLWMVLRTYGAEAIAAAIGRGIALAEHAERIVSRDPWWALVTPAQLGIVTFTHPGWDAADHAASAAALAQTGFATVTSTVLRGQPALRLCTINPLTTEQEIAETLDLLRGPANQPAG